MITGKHSPCKMIKFLPGRETKDAYLCRDNQRIMSLASTIGALVGGGLAAVVAYYISEKSPLAVAAGAGIAAGYFVYQKM